MAADPHINQLEKRHRELEARLDEIMHHPSADDGEVSEIKRQKLLIKDKIARLQAGAAVH